MAIPTTDGQLLDYHAVEPPNGTPRIYYVNGIQTDGKTHAMTAMALSILTERVIHGIYNATAGKGAGIILDLLQCGADWTDILLSKLAEIGNIGVNAALEKVMSFVRGKSGQSQADPINLAESIRSRISAAYRVAFIERCLSTYNQATAALFQQLRNHQAEKQLIIAHSQGNLIAADALWSMVIAFGELSLADMRVYSLSNGRRLAALRRQLVSRSGRTRLGSEHCLEFRHENPQRPGPSSLDRHSAEILNRHSICFSHRLIYKEAKKSSSSGFVQQTLAYWVVLFCNGGEPELEFGTVPAIPEDLQCWRTFGDFGGCCGKRRLALTRRRESSPTDSGLSFCA